MFSSSLQSKCRNCLINDSHLAHYIDIALMTVEVLLRVKLTQSLIVEALPVQPSHTAVPVVDRRALHHQAARHGMVIAIELKFRYFVTFRYHA